MSDTAIWVAFFFLYLWVMVLTAYLVWRPKGDVGFIGAAGMDGPPGPMGNPGKDCDEEALLALQRRIEALEKL